MVAKALLAASGRVVDGISPGWRAVVVLLIVVAIVGVLAIVIGSGSSRKVTQKRQCLLSQKRINVVMH